MEKHLLVHAEMVITIQVLETAGLVIIDVVDVLKVPLTVWHVDQELEELRAQVHVGVDQVTLIQGL